MWNHMFSSSKVLNYGLNSVAVVRYIFKCIDPMLNKEFNGILTYVSGFYGNAIK
jgi:hypothetical protein